MPIRVTRVDYSIVIIRYLRSRGERSAEFVANIGRNSDKLWFMGMVSLVQQADRRSSKIIGVALRASAVKIFHQDGARKNAEN